MGVQRWFQLLNNVLKTVILFIAPNSFSVRVRVRFPFYPGLVKDSVRPRGDPPGNVNGGARFASVDRPSHAGIDV